MDFSGISTSRRPMVGTIGCARKGEIPTITAGSHGGNMDDNLVDEHLEVFFPSNSKGIARFRDAHAAMGEGELTGEGSIFLPKYWFKLMLLILSFHQKPGIMKGMVSTHGFVRTIQKRKGLRRNGPTNIPIKIIQYERSSYGSSGI